MVADDQRRAVAVVGPVEALEQAVAHLVAPELVLVPVALGRGAGLVDHEVVVHRELLVGVPGEGHELHRQVPQTLLLLRPDLVVDTAGVIAEAQLAGGLHEVLLALQARGAGADELLVVVERQRGGLRHPGVGLPGLHELLRLGDLVLPLRDRPLADPAAAAAEVPVEVGTDLVALQPREAQLLDGVGDALLVVEADVGAARGVLRRLVLVALVLRQHVHATQEVRHRRVIRPGDRTEVGEQLLAVLAGAVPGEHHELRGLFAGLEALGSGQVRLRSGVRGGAVADQAEHPLGRGQSGLHLLRAGGSSLGDVGAGGATGERGGADRGDHGSCGNPVGGGHVPPTFFLLSGPTTAPPSSHGLEKELVRQADEIATSPI